jgi:rod shape-determining protein MreD
MTPTFYARVGRALLVGVPLVVTLFFVFMTLLPFGTLGGHPLTPAFGFAAVFYWTLRRPDIYPPVVVFTAGVMQDLAGGGAMGLWALSFLVGYLFLLSQRVLFVGRVAYPALVGFAMALLITLGSAWAVSSGLQGEWLNPVPVLAQAGLTLIAFPVVTTICAFIEAQLPESD